MNVLILAGGKGRRLWPLSKGSYPKQFFRWSKGPSLLYQTILRFSDPSFETIYIVTSASYRALVEKNIPQELKAKCEIILEPYSKNTMAALSYAISVMHLQGKRDFPLFVTPSDHVISSKKLFVKDVLALKSTLPRKFFGLLGVDPLYPETDYGYIHLNQKTDQENTFVKRFVEKPPFEKAEAYVKSGEYLWNTGMLFFYSQDFLDCLEKHCPNMYESLMEGPEQMAESFSSFSPESFDQAILEKTGQLMVRALSCDWSDIGSWDRMYERLDKDLEKNVKKGEIVTFNTSSCLLYSTKKPIYTMGIKDLIVVETEEQIFIGKRGSLKDMKKILLKNP